MIYFKQFTVECEIYQLNQS